MKINIKELQNLPEKTLRVDFREIIKDLENDVPVDAVLDISLTNYGVNIEGHLKTVLKLVCDRCLGEYNYNVDIDFNEDFVNDSIVTSDQKEIELGKGQFVEELRGRDEIDITDFLYQIAVLEVPIQKICKESCEGSEEYKILNSEKIHEKIDERLEVFKSFSENNFSNDK